MPRALFLLVPTLGLAFLASCNGSDQPATSPKPDTENTMANAQPQRPVRLTEEEWRQRLTPEQYHILREKGTEHAFTGKYWDTHEKGVYRCAACGYVLFVSDSKFDSHCGWPSFDREAPGAHIEKHIDTSLGMTRTEVVCPNCGGHLGHLFDDGPTATGERYCINSASIDFIPEGDNPPADAKPDPIPSPKPDESRK